jgi:protein phosphatase
MDIKKIESQRIQWSGITDPGRFRKNNEDAFLALQFNAKEVLRLGKYGQANLEQADYIFAVSDGMGGANAGEYASQIAVNKMIKLFPQTFRASATGFHLGFQDILAELFDQIHRELWHLSICYPDVRGMGATLSLCWVRLNCIYFAHIGDSRIYHLPQAGGLRQVTHDHTHVGWLRRQGQLSELQSRTHAGRHALQQVLGGKTQKLNPHFGAILCEPGDRFVLCTDGLTEGLWDSGIQRIVRESSACEKTAARLVGESVKTDGKDNTTALVIEFESGGCA